MGRREIVDSLSSSKQLQILWAIDGDHSFKTRKVSGRTEEENRMLAIKAIDQHLNGFVKRLSKDKGNRFRGCFDSFFQTLPRDFL